MPETWRRSERGVEYGEGSSQADKGPPASITSVLQDTFHNKAMFDVELQVPCESQFVSAAMLACLILHKRLYRPRNST